MTFDILRHRWLSGGTVFFAGCVMVFIFAVVAPLTFEDNPSEASFVGILLIGGIAWVVIFFTQFLPRIVSRRPVMRWVVYVCVLGAGIMLLGFIVLLHGMRGGFNAIG
jgi:hypothetical protein